MPNLRIARANLGNECYMTGRTDSISIVAAIAGFAFLLFTVHAESQTTDVNRSGMNFMEVQMQPIPLGGVDPSSPSADEFPIGWYDGLTTKNIAPIVQSGGNMLMPYVGSASLENIRAYLDEAHRHRAGVLMEIWREEVKGGDLNAIRAYVSNLKAHPAIRAWYIYDEPELSRIHPKVLKAAYDVIIAEDPTRPVAVVFHDSVRARRYRGAFDIYMWDDYPCFASSQPLQNMDDFRRNLSTASENARLARAFWPVLQAYGEDETGRPQFDHRLPTQAEMRYMMFAALLEKPTGLFFWWWYGTHQDWIRSVLTPLVKELHAYLPAVRAGPILGKVILSSSDSRAGLFKDPISGAYLLILINDSNVAVKGSFKLVSPLKAKSIRRIGRDSMFLSPKNGIVVDSFEAYGVHVYDIR